MEYFWFLHCSSVQVNCQFFVFFLYYNFLSTREKNKRKCEYKCDGEQYENKIQINQPYAELNARAAYTCYIGRNVAFCKYMKTKKYNNICRRTFVDGMNRLLTALNCEIHATSARSILLCYYIMFVRRLLLWRLHTYSDVILFFCFSTINV